MSNIQWTDSQIQAIEKSGCDILVSAAAGSGKTAVLTERIIRKLIDPSSTSNITDFLIVTFTVSATGELREKLSEAIKKAYQETRLKRLKRQLISLPNAKISTIDSFCKFVVSECKKELSIPCDFELADEAEINSLMKSVASECIDEFFSGAPLNTLYDTDFLPKGTRRGFISLVETFSDTKSFNTLLDIIVATYIKLLKYPEPFERASDYLRESANILNEHYKKKSKKSFFETSIGKALTAEVKEQLKVAVKYFENAEKSLEGFDLLCEKYGDIIREDLKNTSSALLETDGQKMLIKIAEFAFSRLPTIKTTTDREIEHKEDFQAFRDAGKKTVTALKEKYPIFDEEALFSQIANTFSIGNELFSLIKAFHEKLWEKKMEKKILSFADISQLAYRALVKEGTYNRKTREFEKTDYALELSEKFEEILIDEYQDVNELQDTIFRAVSNSHNRFMVGDLKQSIYKFRGATPEIFFNYRNTFTPIDEHKDGEGKPCLISLQNNFRSDFSVINFVNSLFDVVMNYDSDEVYKKEDFLVCSKKDTRTLPVELVVFGDDSEYEFVADEIMKNVREKSFDFSEIAILTRTHSSLAKMQEILKWRDIPSTYSPSANFFSSFEIETVLSLLRAVDNPADDVSLLSLLTSPIFLFSSSELLEIRRLDRASDFYFALKKCATSEGKNELIVKCRNAIDKISEWKAMSRRLSSDDFLWAIYNKTHIFSIISKLTESDARKDNLIALYNCARSYESREFRGLTKFLIYIDTLINSKSFDSQKSPFENSVVLTTIHDSKGLEYPLTFYVGAGEKLNHRDESEKLTISEDFGPAFAIPTGKLGGKLTTYLKKLTASEIRRSSVDEELRLLYVALTRAKNKLYVTGKANPTKLIRDLKIAKASKTVMSNLIKTSSTMMKMICIGLMKEEGFEKAILSYKSGKEERVNDSLSLKVYDEYEPLYLLNDITEADTKSITRIDKSDVLFSLSDVRTKEIYQTPYKIAVSAIREGLLDEGASEDISTPKRYPDFMAGESENRSAFTGTAMHVFMQFCDFEKCIENGTQKEAERLFKEEFITKDQFEVLNHKALSAFFTSKIYKEITSSKRVEREKRYTIALPSSKFYDSEEKKSALDEISATTLIQGVIDCYFENDDKTLTLIDFKTDNVNKRDGEKILKERHSRQLSLYREALEKIEDKKVSKTIIYSFCLGREIEIDIKGD